MQASIWLVLVQVSAVLLLTAALAEAGFVLASRLRRYGYERSAFRRSLERFEEELQTARLRRIDREGEQGSWSGYRKFQVSRKDAEGGGIYSFYLEAHDRKPISGYRPGQYLTFSLRIPGENRPVTRCYSLSDAPRSECYRVSIKKLSPPRDKPEAPPGKASNFFCDHVQVGDILDIESPAGQFFLDVSHSSPAVLIAGGVGITPLLSMLNAIATRGFDREVWFFYGVRDPSERIFVEHLNQMASRFAQKLHLHVCYSDLKENDPLDTPPVLAHRQHASIDLLRSVLPSNNFDFFICGPPPMMDSITHDLREWGVPDGNVHFESFGPATARNTIQAQSIAAAVASGIKVTFARSGKEIDWDPGVGTLLELAWQNGVDIDSGCRTGNCGSCVTAIKGGEVDYLIKPGNPPDAGSCLTCITVPKTDVVLDA